MTSPPPEFETPATGELFDASNTFPLGSNNLQPLWGLYEQRLKYRTGKYFAGLPKPIDTIYDKVFYGKVDRFQNAIVPKTDTTLVKQASTQENVFVFDFVADAFFSLQRNLKIAGDSGGIERYNTVLYEMTGVGGMYDYTKLYEAVFEGFLSSHARYLRTFTKKEFNKVVTFQDYLRSMIKYLKAGLYKWPVTLTAYVLSGATPPNLSGLALETAKQSYSDDMEKYRRYFLDANFRYYVRAARKFGFYVDRNGPWRLFADVFSPPMAEPDGFIATANQVSGDIEKNFFNSYYDRTYTLDLPMMQGMLLDSYNEFASQNKKIIETLPGLSSRGIASRGTGTVGSCGTALKILGHRSQIDNSYLEDLGVDFWLWFYFNVRMAESGVNYSDSAFLIREASYRAGTFGLDRALIYVNNLFKPYLYDERIFKSPLTRNQESVRVGSVEDASTRIVGGSRYSQD